MKPFTKAHWRAGWNEQDWLEHQLRILRFKAAIADIVVLGILITGVIALLHHL